MFVVSVSVRKVSVLSLVAVSRLLFVSVESAEYLSYILLLVL